MTIRLKNDGIMQWYREHLKDASIDTWICPCLNIWKHKKLFFLGDIVEGISLLTLEMYSKILDRHHLCLLLTLDMHSSKLLALLLC